MPLVVDSDFASLEEAIAGTKAPHGLQDALALVDVEYVSFDGLLHKGQLVVLGELALEVEHIFRDLRKLEFPIHRIVPIMMCDWDDDLSMARNHTSAFNYRYIAGTRRRSKHAWGRAIDINPIQNPMYAKSGNVYPPTGQYDPCAPGTLTKDSRAVAVFKERGWAWGGDWKSPVDYQHFEKPKRASGGRG